MAIFKGQREAAPNAATASFENEAVCDGMGERAARLDSGTVCRVLTETWGLLRVEPASLPLPDDVLLFPLTETRGRPSSRTEFGHFAQSRWTATGDGRHEVALHPGLFSDPEDLLLVLLHEAVHGLLLDQNLGCSPNGHYHRREFRDKCLEAGILCEWADTRHGWNLTRWPEGGVPARYRAALEHLRDRLRIASVRKVRPGDQPGAPLPAPGRAKLACRCRSPRVIYVARGVAAGGGIRCDLCGEVFSPLVAEAE